MRPKERVLAKCIDIYSSEKSSFCDANEDLCSHVIMCSMWNWICRFMPSCLLQVLLLLNFVVHKMDEIFDSEIYAECNVAFSSEFASSAA